MLNEVSVTSFAKLNLHLRVLPKRDDGYHDIESLFQVIDLYDDISVAIVHGEIGCRIKTEFDLPTPNTLTRAYDEYCEYTGIQYGVRVSLFKRIYSGAGLGGGSSNAAALIHALDVLFETKLSMAEKENIAIKVGSDVPFFLYGGAAIVTGRGEFVRSIKARDDLFFVIIKPNVHSSTKEAFSYFDEHIDKIKTLKVLTVDNIEDDYWKSVTSWSFANDFTDLLVKKFPCIGEAIKSLDMHGSLFTQMSGSGSTVFGVFDTEENAKRAYTQLCLEWECHLAMPIL